MMNILNGGVARRLQRRHPGVHDRADRRGRRFREALRWGAEVYHALKKVLKEQGPVDRPRRRGRLRPEPASNRDALDLILEAIEQAGYTPGARHRARARRRRLRVLQGRRATSSRAGTKTAAEMIDYYAELVAAYPLVSIEDPLDEDDWAGWKAHHRPARRQGPARRRRPVRHQPGAPAAASRRARPTPCSSRSTRSAR